MRVGIDSVEIARIEKSILRPGFLERVYSEEELCLFRKRNMRAETIAANFAVKEAFSKAIGTGVVGFSLKDVCALRDESGAPYLKLIGSAKSLAQGLSFTVSITHTETTATAIVIAYKDDV